MSLKKKFLARYWGREVRLETKMRLMDERFRANGSESMRDFATRKIAAFRACDPEMCEDEITRIIICQLPYRIQDLLKSVLPIDNDRLQELLARYDQMPMIPDRRIRGRNEVNNINRIVSRDRVQGSINNTYRNNGNSSVRNRDRQGGRLGNGVSWRNRASDLGNDNCVLRGEVAESAGIQVRADRSNETSSAEN